MIPVLPGAMIPVLPGAGSIFAAVLNARAVAEAVGEAAGGGGGGHGRLTIITGVQTALAAGNREDAFDRG